MQNKTSIDSSTSFDYLNKAKNNNSNNNLNKNNLDKNNINNPRTKLNFNEICNYKMEINNFSRRKYIFKNTIDGNKIKNISI